MVEERDRILRVYGVELDRIMQVLERQFVVLHNRAQVMLGICGIVITTTGFSGRIIAGTSPLAQVLVIAGISTVLVAALLVVIGVLHLRWLTQQLGEDVSAWLETSLAYRNEKTNYYRMALVLMLCGLALYVAAIAMMLLDPRAGPPVGGPR